MINCDLIPFPAKRDEDLRRWLNHPETQTLLSAAQAQVKHYQAMALKDAVQATENNFKLEAANQHMAQAHRYQTFVEVLTEFMQPETTFHTAKLT